MAPAETVALTAPNGVKIDLPTGLFINNEFVKSSAGAKISSINPSNESEITSVEAASPDDIDIAVKAARAAFESPEWRDLPGTDRGSCSTASPRSSTSTRRRSPRSRPGTTARPTR
ncbi:hypothetical protein V2G26_007665 [Clonostachys chloroleuca]